MSERMRSLFTYILVFLLLLVILAVISPPQFHAIIDVFSQSAGLILVLIIIALIVYFLKRIEEI